MFGILIVALIIGVLVAGGPPAVDMGLALGSATAERARAIDANRQRKHERRMAWGEFFRKAWEDRRQRRHEKAGGTGRYKPGARTYLGELYAGFWWRKIRDLRQRQGIDPPPPYEPPGPQVPGEDGPAAPTPDDGEPPADQPDEPVAPAEGAPAGQPPAADQPTGPREPSVQDCDVCGEPTFRNFGRWRHRDCSFCAGCGQPIPRRTDRTVNGGHTYHPACEPQGQRDPEPTTQPPVQGGDSKEEPVTGPAGAPPRAQEEIHNNAGLRRLFEANQADGRKLLDDVAVMEECRSAMLQAAQIALDAANSVSDADGLARLDPMVEAILVEIKQLVGAEQLGKWSELADKVIGTAQAGLQGLEKWLETEAFVEEKGVNAEALTSPAAA